MATKKETYTYSEAMKRLEVIVSKIEGNELDIDELGNYLKEAQKLIKFCKDKLYKTDQEIQRMLEEDVDPSPSSMPGK
ncbi:MAG TPA: exodeoxyribonuclease VII small subunit [Candidatus Phocaeicola excrementigallinarum]|nr:exodeoxyribonuclease VII small subunit [Candidatus Phocaeicola excrementigallinarum]